MILFSFCLSTSEGNPDVRSLARRRKSCLKVSHIQSQLWIETKTQRLLNIQQQQGKDYEAKNIITPAVVRINRTNIGACLKLIYSDTSKFNKTWARIKAKNSLGSLLKA